LGIQDFHGRFILWSSGLRHCVVWDVVTSILETHADSIFRDFDLMTETAGSSVTFITTNKTTRCHNQKIIRQVGSLKNNQKHQEDSEGAHKIVAVNNA
jgi:hypothetical protein